MMLIRIGTMKNFILVLFGLMLVSDLQDGGLI